MSWSTAIFPQQDQVRRLFEEGFFQQMPVHRPLKALEAPEMLPRAECEPLTSGASFCPSLLTDRFVGEFSDFPVGGQGWKDSLLLAIPEFGACAARALRRLADANDGAIIYGPSRVLVPFPYVEVDGVAFGLTVIAPDLVRASWCFGIQSGDA